MKPGLWRASAEAWLWRHGWSWPIALLLGASAAVVHFGFGPPARQALEAARLSARLAASTPRPPVRTEWSLARLQAPLHASPAAAELAGKLAVLAQAHGVGTSQSDYQVSLHPAVGLAQLQVTQPVRATYPQFRGYIESVLRELPAASLDHVSARREHVGQGQLDIRLRWSFWQPAPPVQEGR